MLKRKPNKFETAIILTLIIIIGLYFYIKKIHIPNYKDFKQTKLRLKSLTAQVEGLGTKPDIKEAKENVKMAEMEAERIDSILQNIINNDKSQFIKSITDVIVEINKFSIKNGVEIESLVLLNKNSNVESNAEKSEDEEEIYTEKNFEKNNNENDEQDEQNEIENVEHVETEHTQHNNENIVDDFVWIIYDIHISGGYNNIADFIKSLEGTSKIVKIEHIDLHKIGAQEKYKAFLKVNI